MCCCDDTAELYKQKFSLNYLEVVSLCLCADDIPLQRLVTPPIIIPYGPFWDEIEGWWGDLVNEVGEIPFGANEYFVEHIKPSLSEHCMFVRCICQEKFVHGICANGDASWLRSYNTMLCWVLLCMQLSGQALKPATTANVVGNVLHALSGGAVKWATLLSKHRHLNRVIHVAVLLALNPSMPTLH